MKLVFITSLILLCICSRGYGEDDPGESSQINRNNTKDEISWGNYILHSLPSSYLYDVGFLHKSNCAIALMKTIPSDMNLENIDKTDKLMKEREKVFEEVVKDGVRILKKSKLFA